MLLYEYQEWLCPSLPFAIASILALHVAFSGCFSGCEPRSLQAEKTQRESDIQDATRTLRSLLCLSSSLSSIHVTSEPRTSATTTRNAGL